MAGSKTKPPYEENTKNMLTYAKSLFGETDVVVEIGDVDGSGTINIMDILYIVDYLFSGGPASTDINQSDVNGSCEVNISDIMYLVDYVFGPGPAPVEGCVVR